VDLFGAGLHAAFADIVGAVTDDNLLVICLEDCQWLDVASAAVLASLTQRLQSQRLFLVFTSRNDYEGHLASHPFDARCVQLPPLDDPVSEELMHSVVHDRGGGESILSSRIRQPLARSRRRAPLAAVCNSGSEAAPF
jgi:hypothetical protein